MSTLDRYIARQYLFNVVALLVLLFSFVVVVDVTLNIDRMFKVATAFAKDQDLSGIAKTSLVVQLAADLWWPRLLQLFVFLLGMVLMGAMGFTLAQIVRHRELVAMLASGISLRRAARPILIVAALMTFVQILDQELVIPRIAPLLTRDHGDAGKHELRGFGVPLTSDSKGRLFYARDFQPGENGQGGELADVFVWEREKSGQATRQIKAARAVWGDGGWEMTGAEARRLDLQGVEAPDDPAGASAPGTVRIETDLDPTALTLRHYANFSHSLSWGQMSKMLRSDQLDSRLREKLERIRWGRISTIVSNFLAMLIVMPFFLTREPKNMVLQSLKCAPVGIVTLLGAVLGASAPVPGLPAALAAFLPVMVLAPIAVGSLAAMKT